MQEVIRVHQSRHDAGKALSEPAELIALPSQDRLGVRVRDAVLADLPFIDALQKKHSKAVGWMPTGQLEGHIKKGHVLVAEQREGSRGQGVEGPSDKTGESGSLTHSNPKPLNPSAPSCTLDPLATDPLATSRALPVGYCIGVDKYFKREEAGIIYQMNIEPGHQRGLLGATLLQAMFDRWPYGVRLCCCWCAQDLQANRFWEAMGFVPLAFRSGSKKRDRVHIFWQKQIRRPRKCPRNVASTDHHHATPQGTYSEEGQIPGVGWWFPSQTGGGALREDRIVLPIPPGTHWSDAKPRIFPEVSELIESAAAERKALEAPRREAERARKREQKEAEKARAEQAAAQSETVAAGGLRFGSASSGEGQGAKGSGVKGSGDKGVAVEGAKGKKPKPKNDPRLVAAARELRDRWLEHAAAQPGLIEQNNTAARRYDVGRSIEPASPEVLPEVLPSVMTPTALPQRSRSSSEAA